MKNKIIYAILILLLPWQTFSQDAKEKDSLSLIFTGDVMRHDAQIQSAFDPQTLTYNYEDVFSKVSPIIEKADFSIANLEVTLAGNPYTGYPQFSSPDALAIVCKNSGIDVLVTANNHSCDKGKKGIVRTLKVLDSLGIHHTGIFKDVTDREKNNLLVLNKNNIKVGILNYTYGTNGLAIPKPTLVNMIDTVTILQDIRESKEASLDKLIVMLHWGKEYQSHPLQSQVELAEFLFKNGVDIIVGSHPHVLQKMEYSPKTEEEHLIAYSLGNFVSNQRTRKRDGGAMLRLTLTKENNNTNIARSGFYLTWVNKPMIHGKRKFEIVPCSEYESNGFYDLDTDAKENMKVFIADSRALLEKENVAVTEIKGDGQQSKNIHVPYMSTRHLYKP